MREEHRMQEDLCHCGRDHQKDAEAIRHEMLDEDVLFDLADFFKLFGDSTRVKILYALSQSELCVGDIAELLCMTQSAISHQLRVLKQSKLVKGRREVAMATPAGRKRWKSISRLGPEPGESRPI